MPKQRIDRLLDELEEQKTRFGRGEVVRMAKLLSVLERTRLQNPKQLIRLHEALLFLRAFPHGPSVLARSEKLLRGFSARVVALQARNVDLSDLDTFEASGIAGTTMQDVLTFEVTRWLVRRIPGQVEIAWDDQEDERPLGTVLPYLIPLLDDDSNVEADTPWIRWLRAAKYGRELEWLIRRFQALPLPDKQKSVMYEALKLPIRWNVPNTRFSRTLNWSRPRAIHYHQQPLITRREVSLADELSKPHPNLQRLSLKKGSTVTDLIREIMAVRYRELYGTTLADPRSIVKFEMGRGVSIYLWNLPPERRLPLRAYTAGFTLKNGVPINYIEAIGLCEWVEIGFNTFYTFRDGETAWVYAQVLRCLRALLGVSCFSVYPYQIGKDNDEAIDSGAFWFYRKLGFRPGRADLLELTRREEKRIAANPKYRTSPRILRRLADDHVFYELPDADVGAWDTFSTRNLGLRTSRVMGKQFAGNDQKMHARAVGEVSRALQVNPTRWTSLEKKAFEDWSLILRLIPSLASWTRHEKDSVIELIRAKAAPNEMKFLHLTQRHKKLRRELLRIGSHV
jgi:hypothetical protein